MIGPKDFYCSVSERYRPDYRGVEFEIVHLGHEESSVRNTRSGGLLRLPNKELFSTVDQRVRSLKRHDARQGAPYAQSPKARKRRY